jgi:hypothetical protein
MHMTNGGDLDERGHGKLRLLSRMLQRLEFAW